MLIRYRKRRIVCHRPIESAHEEVHPVFGVKIIPEKSQDIAAAIGKILLCVQNGADELVEVTLEASSGYSDESLVLIVRNQGIRWSEYSKLMQRRADLGGKGEIRRGLLPVRNDDAHLIDNVALTHGFQETACEAASQDSHLVVLKIFNYFSDAVADHIVHQPPGQVPYPVMLVAEERSGKTFLSQVISVNALHVHRWPAQVPLPNESAHVQCHRHELRLVAHGKLPACCLGDTDQILGLVAVYRKRLFHIDVTAGFETFPRKEVVALWGRCDVYHVGPRDLEEFLHVCAVMFDGIALRQLLRHHLLAVAGTDDFAPPNSKNLPDVFVGDLAAAYDSDANHHHPLLLHELEIPSRGLVKRDPRHPARPLF